MSYYFKVLSAMFVLILVACSNAAEQAGAGKDDRLGLGQDIITKPANGDIDVPITTTIQVTFDEQKTGLTKNDFQLCPVVDGVLKCEDAVVFTLQVQDTHNYILKDLLTLSNPLGLDPASDYQLILFNSDPAIKRDFLFSTTKLPSITGTIPFDTANGASLIGSISAQFSEAIALDSITGKMTVTGPNGIIKGVIALINESELHFTPNQPLTFNTTYQVVVARGIQDLVGNQLANTFRWQFNSGRRIDAITRHTCARFVNGRIKCWGANVQGELGLGDLNNRGDAGGTDPNTTEMGANLPTVPLGTDETGAELYVVQIAVGSLHNCARFVNGEVKCWGNNSFGQLGLGNKVSRGRFSAADPLDPNKSVIVGLGDELPPIDFGTNAKTGEPLRAIDIVAGLEYSCVRFKNKRIKCWGSNSLSGPLGLGDTEPRGDDPNEMGDQLPFVDLGSDNNNQALKVVELKSGGKHNCVRFEDSRIKCWGANLSGQLGLGDINHRGDESGPNNENIEMGDNLPFVPFGNDANGIEFNPVEISAGLLHTCARFAGGRIKCWGDNEFGQLGLGDQLSRGDESDSNPAVTDPVLKNVEMGNNLPFVPLDGAAPFKAAEISARMRHNCARSTTARIKCWGDNRLGQLGLGDVNIRGDEGGIDPLTTEMANKLPFIPLGKQDFFEYKVTELTGGDFFHCAVLENGIKCWGFNSKGQLGLGDVETRGDFGGIIDPTTTEMADALPFVLLE